MRSTLALCITLAISLVIFISMAIYASGKIGEWREHRRIKKGIEDDKVHKITFVTSFHKLLFGVFLSAMVLFMPAHWEYFSGDFYIIRGFKTFLMSIHSTTKMFIIDCDFDPIQALFVSDAIQSQGTEVFFNVVRYSYTSYAAILYLFAPLLTAGFVLSLFKGVTEYMRYQYVCKADEVYIISELNERSIELARDIVSEERIAREDTKEREEEKKSKRRYSADRKRVVVFAEVFDKSEERSFELITQAQALGAFCFKRDIVDIGVKRKRINEYTEQKLYFIGENEDENVEQALQMIEDCKKDARFNTQNTHFYVFATTVESEALIDSVDNGKMIVRRVNENKNLVYSTLHDPAISQDEDNDFIFKHAVKEDGIYKLRILIVGLGNYGMELLKTLCWSCQVTKHELEIYVFDKEQNARDRIACFAPDLIANNGNRSSGLPYYKIFFGSEQIIDDENGERVIDNGMDVRTRGFFQRLDSIATGPITAAFVTLGEDELNIETAMGLRSYFGQKAQQKGLPESYKKSPKIYPVVYSPAKNRICSNGLESYGHRSYGITFIGNMEKRYRLEAIEQKELVKKGEDVHLKYGGAADLKDAKTFAETLEKVSGTKDAFVIKSFLQELKRKLDTKLSRWESDLRRFEDRLRQSGKIASSETFSKELLEVKLSIVKQSLKYDPSDEWLVEDRNDYETYIKVIDSKIKHEVARNDVFKALALYEEGGELSYLEKCLEERKIEVVAWCEQLKEIVEAGAGEYYRYEYLRNSSMAVAMHADIKQRVLELCESKGDAEILAIWDADADPCEHKRWMAYMWSAGYRTGKFKSAIAKTHTKLVSVEERSWLDQVKTEGIIKGAHASNDEQ